MSLKVQPINYKSAKGAFFLIKRFSFEGVDNSLGLTGYRPTGPISHDSLERYINILARTKIDCRWLTGGHQNWATDDEKCSPHVIMWCPEPDPWPVPQWGHMPHQEATHPETPKIYGLLRVLGVNWVFEDQPLAGMKKQIEKKWVGRAKTSTFINFNSTILKMLNIKSRTWKFNLIEACPGKSSRNIFPICQKLTHRSPVS